MEYSFIYNGKNYDLPKYNFSIAEKLEKQENINNNSGKFKDKCKSMYELINELIGKESTEELIGKFNDSDPNIINIIYLEIVKAYNQPVADYNADNIDNKLNDSNIGKITDLLNSLQNIDKLKAIK